MKWIKYLAEHWSNTVTAGCLIIVGLIEAWQQAASTLSPSSSLPRLGDGWHYAPLALLIIAGVSWLSGHRHQKPQSSIPAQSPAIVSPGIPTLSALHGMIPQVDFNPFEHFRIAYYSPLTAEVENNIKIAAQRHYPNDHEGFYTKLIGIGIVSYTHDMTWAYIFKSQLMLLMEMNRNNGWIPIAEAKKFYDAAALEYPHVYPQYSFDQWLEYMKGQQLIIRHASDMLEITHRGKDFLKYLAHWGRDVNIKKC